MVWIASALSFLYNAVRTPATPLVGKGKVRKSSELSPDLAEKQQGVWNPNKVSKKETLQGCDDLRQIAADQTSPYAGIQLLNEQRAKIQDWHKLVDDIPIAEYSEQTSSPGAAPKPYPISEADGNDEQDNSDNEDSDADSQTSDDSVNYPFGFVQNWNTKITHIASQSRANVFALTDDEMTENFEHVSIAPIGGHWDTVCGRKIRGYFHLYTNRINQRTWTRSRRTCVTCESKFSLMDR